MHPPYNKSKRNSDQILAEDQYMHAFIALPYSACEVQEQKRQDEDEPEYAAHDCNTFRQARRKQGNMQVPWSQNQNSTGLKKQEMEGEEDAAKADAAIPISLWMKQQQIHPPQTRAHTHSRTLTLRRQQKVDYDSRSDWDSNRKFRTEHTAHAGDISKYIIIFNGRRQGIRRELRGNLVTHKEDIYYTHKNQHRWCLLMSDIGIGRVPGCATDACDTSSVCCGVRHWWGWCPAGDKACKDVPPSANNILCHFVTAASDAS